MALCICLSGADGEAGRVSGALKLVVGSVPRPQVARCRGTKRVLWIEDLGGTWPIPWPWVFVGTRSAASGMGRAGPRTHLGSDARGSRHPVWNATRQHRLALHSRRRSCLRTWHRLRRSQALPPIRCLAPATLCRSPLCVRSAAPTKFSQRFRLHVVGCSGGGGSHRATGVTAATVTCSVAARHCIGLVEMRLSKSFCAPVPVAP